MHAINPNRKERWTTEPKTCVIPAAALALAVVLTAASPALADYWFLGVGNEGYMDDVDGLFGALTQVDNWQEDHVHSWLHEDRPGPQVLNECCRE